MLKIYHSPQSRSSAHPLASSKSWGADCEIVYATSPAATAQAHRTRAIPNPDKKCRRSDHDGVLGHRIPSRLAKYLAEISTPRPVMAPQMGDSKRRSPYLSWLAYYAGVMEPVLHFGLVALPTIRSCPRTFFPVTRADIGRRHPERALEAVSICSARRFRRSTSPLAV